MHVWHVQRRVVKGRRGEAHHRCTMSKRRKWATETTTEGGLLLLLVKVPWQQLLLLLKHGGGWHVAGGVKRMCAARLLVWEGATVNWHRTAASIHHLDWNSRRPCQMGQLLACTTHSLDYAVWAGQRRMTHRRRTLVRSWWACSRCSPSSRNVHAAEYSTSWQPGPVPMTAAMAGRNRPH